MKVAYINFIYRSSPGVEEKLKEKASEAASLDLNIDFYFLNAFKEGIVDRVKYVKIKSMKFPFKSYVSFFKRYDIIEKTIDLKPYDYIIIRYPKADKSGIRFTQKYNVITEHHTDELSEHLSLIKSERSLKRKIINLIHYLQEKRFSKDVLSNCKGLTAVTEEIKKIELSKLQNHIPAIVISNGVNVKAIKQTGFQKFDGKSLNLVMTIGSFSPWHGLDRIISAVNCYAGGVKITLHIIGNVNKADLSHTISDFSRIKFHGFKSGKELDEIMKNMNLAVGSLAMFRVRMEEACTLKTREYTARGIPFVLGYNDSDLQHVDTSYRFYLPIANNDSKVEMDNIINFAKHMSTFSESESISDYMRAYALEHMDWSVKVKQYIEFVEGLEDPSKRG